MTAIFCHFPHGSAEAGRNIPGFLPGTYVRKGDWKLIRFFADNDDGSDRFELYNLQDDVGETKNLAAEKPELVRELNELDHRLSQRHRGRHSHPQSRLQTDSRSAAMQADPLQGWKARGCDAAVKDGVLSVVHRGDAASSAMPPGKRGGPATLTLRIKAAAGRPHIDWLPGGVQDKPHSVEYAIAGEGWEEIAVQLPAVGPLGVVRVYLPTQDDPWKSTGLRSAPKAARSRRARRFESRHQT